MTVGRFGTMLAGTAFLALAGCGGATTGDAGEDGEAAIEAVDPLAAGAAIETENESVADARSDCAGAVLFACSMSDGNELRVCRAEASDGSAYAQYRFGPAGAAPELVLPRGEGQGAEWVTVPYSGGGEAQIAFSNGETSYIVFSRTVRTNFTAGEPNNPEFTDGVAVVRGGDVLSQRLCTGEPESVDVMAGEDYGGVANELFFQG